MPHILSLPSFPHPGLFLSHTHCLHLLRAVHATSVSSERPEQTAVTRGRWHCAAVPSPARAVAHPGALHIHLCLSTGELWCEHEMLLHAAHLVTDLHPCLLQLEDPFPIGYNRQLLASHRLFSHSFHSTSHGSQSCTDKELWSLPPRSIWPSAAFCLQPHTGYLGQVYCKRTSQSSIMSSAGSHNPSLDRKP